MYYKSIKTPIALFLLLLFAVVVPSCAAAEVAEKEWTFMIFMAADNNLEAVTSLDINEIEQYGSTDQVNFVAQIDRNGSFSQDSELKWSGARRFYITRDKKPDKMTSPMLENLGNVDMADPLALADFVSWAKENYPARKYALILWNHGTGWKEIQPDVTEADDSEIGLPAGLQTAISNISYNISYDGTSKTSMDIPTLGETLARVRGILGKPLDILGFDACLMQMAEVSWTAAPYVLYQIGSPDREPERGWPYDLIAGELTTRHDIDAKSLAAFISSAYSKSYSSGSQGNTAVVLSVIDLSKSEDFRDDLNNFCNVARRNIIDIDKYEAAREAALKYSYGDYIDLGHLLSLLVKSNVKSDTKTAAARLLKTIAGEKRKGGYVGRLAKSGDKFASSTGLSIFFPTRQGFKTYKARYKLHTLCEETEWFNFLGEIAEPNIPYLKLEDIVLEDKNKDGRIAAGEEVTVLLSLRNLGKKKLSQAEIACVTHSGLLDSKSYQVELSKLPEPGKATLVPGFKFVVSKDAPVHSEIALNISLNGEGIPLSTLKTVFYVKEPFASTGNALLVLTDNFSPASPVLQQMMQNAGVKFDTWDRMVDGGLRPEVLKRYLEGWVFIASQDSTPEQSFSEEEIDALDQFLKSGGRLVLNGQDLGFALRDSYFLKNRCKAQFVQDDVNVHVVSGANGFAGNKSFQIFGGDGANNQKWPDEIDPLAGAQVIFEYEKGARDKADDREMNGPSHKPGSLSRGVSSSGAAGVKVVDGYRLMLFTFGIEAINNSSQRSSVMKEVANFMQPDAAAEVRNLARAATRRSARQASSSERVVVERADLLSSVEKRLLKQIKEEFDKNPETRTRLLEEIGRLPAGERKAVSNLEKNVQSLLEFNTQHGTLGPR
ncbi:MAG: clostripain-related cysteine peptidase [Candidatus Riflebacteria bacterium]|nr:clostripain-related cysteine peptidase [Candidatus Riflebacteria bacterium]